MAVDKSESRVRRMFASIAPRYDRMNHLLSLNVDRYWRRRTVQMVPPRGPDPILDVCTGTGDLALAYARFTRGHTPVVAADFCPEMLEIGRRKLRRAGPDWSVTFEQADTLALPYPADVFQIVAVAFGLRNVADTDQGLREMTRVCRPRGRVAILEFSLPRRQPIKMIYGWYFRQVLPRLGQLIARNDHQAYGYLPESVDQFPEGAELARRMQVAGLETVHYFPLTFGLATLYIGHKPNHPQPPSDT